MSTAKPQQSSGQSDGSDDLIAELARMMANDAQPQEPTAETASVEPVEEQPATPAPSVRVPGPPEAAEAGGFNFDFGAPPKPAETLRPAPLVNWQDRINKPVERHEPAFVESTPPAPEIPRSEPPASFIAPTRQPEPAIVETTNVAQPQPEPAQPVTFTTHEFDFGFGRAEISEPVAPAAAPPKAAVVENHDAIADLIAAEMTDAQPARIAEPEPEPEVAPPAPKVEVAQAPKPFLRAANFAAPSKPQNDRFDVSPVFGVGQQPKAAEPIAAEPAVAPASKPGAPAAPLDPMDEIESLIGSSIRGDLGGKIETRGPASPISAPREASPIPRATPRPIHDDHGAEAAILAAAAASGETVGRVQARQPQADDKVRLDAPRKVEKAAKPPKAPRAERGSISLRPFVGIGVAAALLIVAGAGLYWVLGNGQGGGDGAAPVLTADTSPTKEPPPEVPASGEQSASVVLNELSGGNQTQVPEQLVSRDQAPDTAAVAAVTPTETTTGDEGLANRKVRTVTVRPDGTIVNADDLLAGGQALPVERPNVPAVPSGNVDGSDLLAAAATANAAAPSPLAPAATSPAEQPGAMAALTPAETPTAIDPANVTPPGMVAPVPRPRIANRPTTAIGPTASASNAVNAIVNDPIGALAAQADTTPTPAVTAQPSSGAGTQAAAYVQLSSQRDENVARQSLVDINQRYGRILGGVLPEVQRVDLGAKGIYYRVRVPTDSMQSANYLCNQIKSASGDCIVTN